MLGFGGQLRVSASDTRSGRLFFAVPVGTLAFCAAQRLLFGFPVVAADFAVALNHFYLDCFRCHVYSVHRSVHLSSVIFTVFSTGDRMDSQFNVLDLEDDDLQVETLLLFVIDSQPEMQGEFCQGWVLEDGVVVQCGERFPVGVPPSKRRDHLFKCAVRTERWAREEGFRLGMRVEPPRHERKVERKSREEPCKTPFRSESQAYSNAKMRCIDSENRSFRNYGGRGIEFRFVAFEEFIDHIGPKPSPDLTLDRINNDGHYEIGNVRWATHQEQHSNRHRKYTRREPVKEIAQGAAQARWNKQKKEKA